MVHEELRMNTLSPGRLEYVVARAAKLRWDGVPHANIDENIIGTTIRQNGKQLFVVLSNYFPTCSLAHSDDHGVAAEQTYALFIKGKGVDEFALYRITYAEDGGPNVATGVEDVFKLYESLHS